MISLAQDNREGQKNSWEVSSVFRKWIKGRAAAGFHYGNYKIRLFSLATLHVIPHKMESLRFC